MAKGVPHPYIDCFRRLGHFEQTLPVLEKEHYKTLQNPFTTKNNSKNY